MNKLKIFSNSKQFTKSQQIIKESNNFMVGKNVVGVTNKSKNNSFGEIMHKEIEFETWETSNIRK